jgi:hypothetical protein
MGAQSSTFQLNLSRFRNKSSPFTPPNTPSHPLNAPYTTPKRNPYPTESAYVELKSERL